LEDEPQFDIWNFNSTAGFKRFYIKSGSCESKIVLCIYYAKDFNCYNVPTSQAAVHFNYVPAQVPLKQTSIGVSCTQPTADLTAVLDNPVGSVLWFNNETHQGPAVQNLQAVPPGNYYAFYYDAGKGGYSLPAGEVSKSHVQVTDVVNAGIPNLGPTLEINSLSFAPVAFKDFVVKIHNIVQQNSGCSVYFLVSKVPGYNIQYNTQAGQSNVDGGITNNNDKWSFSETADFIKVTSKVGMQAGETSVIGFKISRNVGTTAGTSQNLNVTIPVQGGGGEIVFDNNQLTTTLSAN